MSDEDLKSTPSNSTNTNAPNIHIYLEEDMPYGMEDWLNFEKMNVHIHVPTSISEKALIQLQERLETAAANSSRFHRSRALFRPLPPPPFPPLHETSPDD